MSVDDKNDQSVMISLDTLLASDPMLSDLDPNSDSNSATPQNVDLSALDQIGLGDAHQNRTAPITTAAMPVVQQLDLKEPKRMNGVLKFLLITTGIVGLMGGGIYLGMLLQPKNNNPQIVTVVQKNNLVATNQNTTPKPPVKNTQVAAVTAQPDETKTTEKTTDTENTKAQEAEKDKKVASKSRKSKTRKSKYRKSKTKKTTKKEPEAPKEEKKAPAPAPKSSEADDILKKLKNKKNNPNSGKNSTPTPNNTSSDPGLPSKLGRRDILSTVRKNQRSVNACKKLVTEKTRVTVRMIINKSGKVKSAQLLSPANLKGSPLDQCMVGRVSRFVFPKFNGPDMSIKLPFIL